MTSRILEQCRCGREEWVDEKNVLRKCSHCATMGVDVIRNQADAEKANEKAAKKAVKGSQ